MGLQPSQRARFLGILIVLVAISGCGKEKEKAQTSAASGGSAGAANTGAKAIPAIGRVGLVRIASTGTGNTEVAAILQGLRTAVMEVNGARLEDARILQNVHVDVDTSAGNEHLQAQVFAEQISQQSGGVIDHFSVVGVEKPSTPQGVYRVSLDAYINKYQSPKQADKKLKIVVAPIRTDNPSYEVAGTVIAGPELARVLTQMISDALVQTGRFDVLDRQLDPEVQQELSLINSGAAPAKDIAKLGQTVTADAVVFGSVDSLNYLKESRTLAISDRPLVTYHGDWSFGERLVNVTTREVMSSTELTGALPKIGPTTLPVSVDGSKTLANAERAIVDQAVGRIIYSLYPVTVVSNDQDQVILSQGQGAVSAGNNYELERAGKTISDPQTGDVIGRVKTVVGVVHVDRVDDHLAYGHIVGGLASGVTLPTDGSVRVDNKMTQTTDSPTTDKTQSSAMTSKSIGAGTDSGQKGPGGQGLEVSNQLRRMQSNKDQKLVPTHPLIAPAKKDDSW